MPAPGDPFLSRTPEFLQDLGFARRTRLASQWTLVNGCPLHSRSSSPANAGIPFILIHGLVISSLYMIPLAECLAVRHQVYALDLPGFGRSAAPRHILSLPQLADAVIGWLDAMEIGHCHLVGNSLGCEIGAHVAVKAPARVASFTLIGPTLDPAAFAVRTQTLRLLRDALHEPVRLWINWAFDFFRAGVRRALGTTREMFRDHIEHQLPLVTAPALIIRGGIDPTLPREAALTMKRLLPRGELLVIENEPHCVHYTDPVAVCRATEAHAAASMHGGRDSGLAAGGTAA
jgi:2-hydroxy-6-oxonona-2,4-dienedioate hydrolase